MTDYTKLTRAEKTRFNARERAEDAADRAFSALDDLRYAVTIVRRDGTRILFDPQQARYTFATAARAQQRRDAFANSDERSQQVIREVYGPDSVETLAVSAVACYATGDPKSFYVSGGR